MSQLEGKTIALLATDGFEDAELTEPLEAMRAAGATVVIVSEDTDDIEGKNGARITVDAAVEQTAASDYDGLLLPGGVANPDKLRLNAYAVDFVREFFSQHKPVAAICHAPWLLIEADVVTGRTLTSWPSLKTDIQNAGGIWVDQEVVVDQGLVTSRGPDDLAAFAIRSSKSFARASTPDKRHKQ